MQQELLPLFPLQVVLFPRMPVALHIFEDRYKEMIGGCVQSRSEFGIVLAGEKGIVNSGCTAIVDKVVQKYDDGRMDIIALGRRRFEIQSLDTERSYLRGEVSFFDDDEVAGTPDNLRKQVMQLYQQIIKISPNSPLLEPEFNEAQLSFQLAHVLTDVTQRQLLLVARSELDRMRRLAELLPKLLKERHSTAQSMRFAATNGHGKRPDSL
jgi:Lon protease-like protein